MGSNCMEDARLLLRVEVRHNSDANTIRVETKMPPFPVRVFKDDCIYQQDYAPTHVAEKFEYGLRLITLIL